jgi:hypothetical protein
LARRPWWTWPCSARASGKGEGSVRVSEGEAEGEPGHRLIDSRHGARVGGGGASAPAWSPCPRHVPAFEAFYRAVGG